jgi:hypothetical protein
MRRSGPDAVRHGAPPIMVTAARADGADGHGRVIGHDGGPGMDERFLPHAAERLLAVPTPHAPHLAPAWA